MILYKDRIDRPVGRNKQQLTFGDKKNHFIEATISDC